MRDKSDKLIEDFHRLTKSISEGGHSSAAVEAMTAKILDKIQELDSIYHSTLPEMQAQIKIRDKEIRKMKKALQQEKRDNTSLEVKVKELHEKKIKSKKSEAKESLKEEHKLKEEKFEKKYLLCREEVKSKKERIQELERKVEMLEEQNQDLRDQNYEKDLLIRSFSQNRDHYPSTREDTLDNISIAPSRGVMSMTQNEFSEHQAESEPIKAGDDAQTDDQFELDSIQDYESQQEVQRPSQNESPIPIEVVNEALLGEQVQKVEETAGSALEEEAGMRKVLRRVFWFLQ